MALSKTRRKPAKRKPIMIIDCGARETTVIHPPLPKAEPKPSLAWEGTAFELAKIKDLKVTPAQASAVDPQQVQKIARNFKSHLFGVITCIRGPQGLHVVKGVTKLAAILSSDRDITEVPIQCLERSITPEEADLAAAALELDEGRRAKLHPIDQFRRALAAQRVPEVNVLRALQSRRLDLRMYPNEPRMPRTVDCHATWLKIGRLGGTRLIGQVANFIKAFGVNTITGEVMAEARTPAFLLAVANTLTRYGLNENDLLCKLTVKSQRTNIDWLNTVYYRSYPVERCYDSRRNLRHYLEAEFTMLIGYTPA